MSKKTRHEEHEEHADESWLLPYSDLMTLLVALFLVMYAMSATDAKKFEQMSQAFSSALNGGTGILDQRSATPTESQLDQGKNDKMDSVVAPNTGESEIAKLRKQEQEDLEKLKKQFDQYIEKNGLTDLLSTKLNQSQLMITISDNALFASGQAVVKDESRQLAKSISSMLQQFPDYNVLVQGHTDNIPISNSSYSSNWDLSVDRALHFMKILLLNPSLDPVKFSPIGYGEYHPIADNGTAAGRAKNRRVEVSILRKYTDSSETTSVTPPT
ncbi:flagellar motor protein MotB [Paenibacillus sp. FSL R7-0273]|uniref:flagellar motor protein MotB n=1 Tax=Paenibacillus sp. FSL R7-0273 TaxID=1536772 RepID=UPI0004F785E4|nr:flagellar motor protein MotB [Paenibacillus sp. FSL R7-0273]AIQ44560.1 flagellar motor protein MotB [Paenibacillus sp. FSL R7-0273]OMF85100.1 flagellar motor protein MotB [Paenibacillus sp. FSL R7-0273]